MLSFFKSRLFFTILGLALFALFIWFAGPLFTFYVWTPLESVTARLIVLVAALVLVIGAALWKRIQARAASQQLVTAVVAQTGSSNQPSREAQALRERFDEATARLKQNRRGSHTLYELPWYVIIGAPGSGKTTALAHSGLQFPTDQRGARAGARGVGGTRNCDWWFTDRAVFIDTAGRYTTQDSDANADSAAWKDFLALLKKHRQRRPINGVLLAISAQDLLTQGHERRDEHIDAARRRLTELNDEFGIQLPVYVLVTKCDLMAGFTEYFDDQTQEGRAQVWGVTFPYAQARNSDAAAAFPAELDALIQRLNERVLGRLEDERDVRRRARIFGFPQQVAALRESLTGFIGEVFASTRFDRTILLRGVYFTSGTQEGTPIDRLLGALGRRFAVAPEAVVPAGKGKAYFIQRLLQEIIIPEAGLAGVNRRIEIRKAASQLAAYAALIAVAVIGVVLLTVSYRANRTYLTTVAEAVTALKTSPPEPEAAPVERMLPRLSAVAAIFDAATVHRSDVPWHMRWGLYQGAALGEDAREAYVDVLSGPLLARVAERFKSRITEFTDEPLLVYEYLKGYLLLLDPRARDGRPHLRALANAEWEHPLAEESDTGPVLLRHFHRLLDESNGALRAIPKDGDTEEVVVGARRVIRQVSIAELAWRGLKRDTEGQRATSVEMAAGPAARDVLRRKDGVSLSTPIPYVFTVDGFETLSSASAIDGAVRSLADEVWVWGDERMPVESRAEIESRLFDIWSREYIAQWDAVVNNVEVKPLGGAAQTASALSRLTGKASPLRLLLESVARHTRLVKPAAAPAAAPGVVDSLTSQVKSRLGSLAGRGGIRPAAETPATVARRQITTHFDPIRALVAGEGGSAPIDGVLLQLGALQERVEKVGSGVGQEKARDPATQAQIAAAADDVRASAADLPDAVEGFVTKIADSVEGVVLGDLRGDLRKLHEAEVATPCRALVGVGYPVVAGSRTDVTIDDFSRVFGHDGVFDRFYKTTLEGLVEPASGGTLRWRPGIGNADPAPASMLRQFETARAIRDAFFRPGSMKLEVGFRVTPGSIDSNVQRFVFDIDGQMLDYRHEAPRSVPMKWPGPGSTGVVATFHDRSTPAPYLEYKGVFGFVRWLEEAQIVSDSQTRHVVTLTKGSYRAEVRVEADSAINPFQQRALFRRFQCGL